MRLEVVAGDGIVARVGGCVLFVSPDTDERHTAELVAIVRAGGDVALPGRQVARQLAAWLSQLPPDVTPAFGLVAEADKGLAVVLHGAIQLRASGPGLDLDLDGSDRPTWVDDYVSGDATHITVHASGAAPSPGFDQLDLAGGIVPGAGCVLALRDTAAPLQEIPLPEAAEDDHPEPVVEPAPELIEEPHDQADAEVEAEAAGAEAAEAELPAFDVIDLSTLAEGSFAPLPIAGPPVEPDPTTEELVEGKACIRGHFNDLAAQFCSLCGISMVQITEQIVLGRRPPLGILVFEDGMTFSLDSEYVIGREPEGDTAVKDGDARPIEIRDSDIISRIHARIVLDGWDVELVDEGSSNGTFVRERDEWRRLDARSPLKLDSGAEVRLGVEEGARVFTFDSHHRPR